MCSWPQVYRFSPSTVIILKLSFKICLNSLRNFARFSGTDNDNALKAAERFMGGKVRVGEENAEIIEEAFIIKNKLFNVEIIDVSYGQKVRGFNISGPHYWYRHPWMSSDIIFLMRTDLPPHRRGLSPTELEGIWYLSPEYPVKIQKAVEEELRGQW